MKKKERRRLRRRALAEAQPSRPWWRVILTGWRALATLRRRGSERVLVPTPGLGINKSIIEEHERLVRQLFSPLTMGELRKPLARLSPDTARSVQPKPRQCSGLTSRRVFSRADSPMAMAECGDAQTTR